MLKQDMFKKTVLQKVAYLYGDDRANSIAEQIIALVNKWQSMNVEYPAWVDEKTTYLITYGDSFFQQDKKTLRVMKYFADKYLNSVITNIHILPMFPYTSDDGFSVVDYRKIDENLGDWNDLVALSEHFNLMYDCVINHISKSSDWFQKFLSGDEKYQNYFIQCDPKLDYSSVTRPRALPLLTSFKKESGDNVSVWTTFSDDQIDINFHEPKVLLESIDILLLYAAQGGRSIRLDAIGFIWKKLGTSCIHLEQAHQIIQLWRLILDEVFSGTLLITETNVPHIENISYFGQGNEAHMVYQFPLPPLTLYTFLSENSQALTHWARGLTQEAMAMLETKNKTTYFNFLASHDGIGLRPVEGILANQEINMMCQCVENKGGRVSYKNNSDGTQSPYELNINLLSALTEKEDSIEVKAKKFLAAQSILLSFIGVPAIYYHSLLGSENDVEGMKASNINRRINREKFDIDALEHELSITKGLRHTIYTKIVKLLTIRSQQKSFSPSSKQEILEFGQQFFALKRGEGDDAVIFIVNVTSSPQKISLSNSSVDLVTNRTLEKEFILDAYQFVWLKNL